MREFEYEIGGKSYKVVVKEFKGSEARLEVNGETFNVRLTAAGPASAPQSSPADKPSSPRPAPARPMAAASGPGMLAPMPGVILAVKVKPGDRVKKRDVLLVLEAMKMENELRANRDGKIKSVNVEKGSRVNTGDLIIEFE